MDYQSPIKTTSSRLPINYLAICQEDCEDLTEAKLNEYRFYRAPAKETSRGNEYMDAATENESQSISCATPRAAWESDFDDSEWESPSGTDSQGCSTPCQAPLNCIDAIQVPPLVRRHFTQEIEV